MGLLNGPIPDTPGAFCSQTHPAIHAQAPWGRGGLPRSNPRTGPPAGLGLSAPAGSLQSTEAPAAPRGPLAAVPPSSPRSAVIVTHAVGFKRSRGQVAPFSVENTFNQIFSSIANLVQLR